MDPRDTKLAESIEDARTQIEQRIPMRTVTRDPDGAYGKKFTKAFTTYLDKPGEFMDVLRERRYSRKHWEYHLRRGRDGEDRKYQVNWIDCGCQERLGYRVVRGVVIERRTIGDLSRETGVIRITIKRILESELRVISNLVEVRGTK